ncbi:hypothetical protein V6Z11_A13G050100 [Gossypium hirsutum]
MVKFLNPSLHSSLPFLAGPVPANSQGNDPPTPRKLSGNRLYVDAMLLDEFSCSFFCLNCLLICGEFFA